MLGTEFANTLRRNWRQIFMWGGVLAAFGFLIAVIIQDIDALEQYSAIVESMPPIVMQAFGASDATVMSTPEGYIAFGAFTYGAFIMAAFGVVAGIGLSASDEENGILDMVLSLPIPRWRIIAERFAAYTVVIIGISLVMFAGLFAGGEVSPFDLDYGRVLGACLNLVPFTMLTMSVTGLLATILHRQAVITGAAAMFVLVSYLIDFLGNAASQTFLADLKVLSYFHYYDSEGTMINGIAWANVLGMTAVALVLIAAALYFFDRRDVGV